MNDKKIFSRIGFNYFIFLSVSIGLQLLMAFVFDKLDVKLPPGLHWMALFLSMAPMYLIAAPLTVFLFQRVPRAENLEKKKLGAGAFWVIFVIGVSAMQLGNLIGQAMMKIVEMWTGRQMDFELQEVILNTEPWVILVLVVVIGPMIEELLFRRMLIDRIKGYGEGTSVVMSGLLFGLFHGNFYQFFYAFALGAIFGYVYCKTSRLRYTVIMHMMINFMGSILVILMMRMPGMEPFLDPAMQAEAMTFEMIQKALPGLLMFCLYGILLFGTVVAGIVLFICFFKRIRLEPGYRNLKGVRLKTIFLNVGMILCLLVSLVSFAL